jgi:hypothetical protein
MSERFSICLSKLDSSTCISSPVSFLKSEDKRLENQGAVGLAVGPNELAISLQLQ